MTQCLAATRSEFIEKIGLMAQADGLPRIAGRVLGLLVWDGAAVSFGELAQSLLVSRASISTATRILEQRRLIKRIAKPGQRQDFWQLADNPYSKLLEYFADGMIRARGEIAQTIAHIPDDEAEIKARVQAYADFYRAMSEAVAKLAQDLGQERAEF